MRWLPHSVFDHEAHRMLACASCHPRALSSKETSDVLLPGIQVCRQCHHQKGIEARCFECHEYHDWTQRERVKGTFSIQQLLKGTTVVEPSREAGEPVPGQ